MKNSLLCVLTSLFFSCGNIDLSNDADFDIGKRQLEAMGYSEVEKSNEPVFCMCGPWDIYQTAFTCKDEAGNTIHGFVCSGPQTGVTLRFK